MAGGLMQTLGSPEFLNWISGVGAGLSRAGAGQGYDISAANQQLFQSMADKKAKERLGGLMEQLGLNPQQRTIAGELPVDTQRQILARQAGLGGAEKMTDMERAWSMLSPEERVQAAKIASGLAPKVGGGAFEGTSMDAQMYNIWIDPNSSPQQRAMAEHYFRRPKLQQTPEGLTWVPGQPPPNVAGAPAAPPAASPAPAPDPQTGVVPGTEKNPNAVSAEGAGRVAGAKRILERSDDSKPGGADWRLLMDEDGTLDRQTLAQINNGVIVTDKAQRAYNYLFNLMDTKLRIMTGAAAPEEEVRRNVMSILPSTYSAAGADSYMSAIQNEIKFLEEFVNVQAKTPSGMVEAPEMNESPFKGFDISKGDQQAIMQAPPGSEVEIAGKGVFIWDGRKLVPAE